MLKYCFNVYDKESGTKITSVITNADSMLTVIDELSKLGIVKGYILDDKESEEK